MPYAPHSFLAVAVYDMLEKIDSSSGCSSRSIKEVYGTVFSRGTAQEDYCGIGVEQLIRI